MPATSSASIPARTAASPSASGLRNWRRSDLELDPGTAAMCHLSVATKNIAAERYHGDILGPLYHEAAVVWEPLRMAEGAVWCPDGPGLGIEVDWDRVRALEIG
jgi:L-alanine-DL-glutamate epimerase-like enolase superfamily enzyme